MANREKSLVKALTTIASMSEEFKLETLVNVMDVDDLQNIAEAILEHTPFIKNMDQMELPL